MVAILPIIGVMVTRASRKFRRQSQKIQATMGDLTHVASETIQGYRVVRSFGGENYESARFRAASEDNRAKQLRMVRTSATYTPALQFVTFSAMAAVLVPGPAAARRRLGRRPGRLHHRRRDVAETDSPAVRSQLDDSEGAGRRREHFFPARRTSRSPIRARIEKIESQRALEVKDLSFAYPGSSSGSRPGQLLGRTGTDGRPRRALG
jgi:subfamily B ATP-binding cassette protein MsbA